MIKNYFKTALRHLLKNKETTLINVLGLALGIACLLIILVMVRFELSFDRFHSKANHIYRVVRVSQIDGETDYSSAVAYPVPAALKTSLAAIQQITALQGEGASQFTVYDEQTGEIARQFREDQGLVFADSAFFNIFDFKGADFHWIAGNPETALKEPNTLVLTASVAHKYFPDGNALGKTIKINNRANYTITGVVSDFPPNTDFPFRILASCETLKTTNENLFSDWMSIGPHQSYLVLRDGTDPREVEEQFLAVHAAHVEPDLAENRIYKLQPLHEVHTDTRFINFRNRTVSWETIGALLIIGLFLIVTAVINFINLTTAQAVMRAKEVCVRKVMGSGRMQLISQFLGETFIITSLAGLLALGAAELVMVYQQELLQVTLEKALILEPFVVFALLLIVVVVALLAGVYPALVLSRFNPVATIRNNNFGLKKGAGLRWGLVTLQFVIAQVFIIGTIVVIRQMEYFRQADLGFDKEAIITLRLPENETRTLQTLKNQWSAIAQVADVSMAFTVPSGEKRYGNWQDIRRKGTPAEEGGIIFEHQSIDERYLELYQIPLLAGRNFVPTDTMQSIIINRNLAERVGFAEPADAIGETMLIFDQPYDVVGVSENFHTSSLREGLDYVAFTMNPRRYYHASIKMNVGTNQGNTVGSVQETLKQIEKVWAATFPEYVFDYRFLDESIAAFYKEEARLSKLFKMLAGITIFIGCLGLYGLVAFMAVRRTKEVGIRKVLGASVSHIVVLFSKEFIALVVIAFCIAGPIAYYMMQQWLHNFVFRIDLGAEVFITAILASLLIALLTVSYQAMKAAFANPVDSLKNE